MKVKDLIEFKKNKTGSREILKTESLLKALRLGLIKQEQKIELAQRLIDSNVRMIHLENKIANEALIEKEDLELQELYKLKKTEMDTKNLEIQRLKSKLISERINYISNDRYKFSYGNNTDDFVDLYLGSFGWKKETLWIDSDNIEKIETVVKFIDNIKQSEQFKEIKCIEFASNREMIKTYVKTGRITLDKKQIYKIQC